MGQAGPDPGLAWPRPPLAIIRARSTQSSLGMAMLRCGAGVFKLTYTLRYEWGLREPSRLTRCSTSTIPRTSIRSCFRATRSQVRSPPPLLTKCASGAARSLPSSHACCPSPLDARSVHAEGLIVRGRWRAAEDRQIEVRIMIPFTLCCTTCKEFSYRGKKFNSKKEIAQDIDYLGISIHR